MNEKLCNFVHVVKSSCDHGHVITSFPSEGRFTLVIKPGINMGDVTVSRFQEPAESFVRYALLGQKNKMFFQLKQSIFFVIFIGQYDFVYYSS